MATPEGKVKDWFKKELAKRYPLSKRIRWPAGQYGTVGVSDDICCINGYFVAIEAKANTRGNPTKIQAQFLLDVINAGGLGLVLRGKDESIFTVIDLWLKNKDNFRKPTSIEDFMI